jgi:hypothetical protein
MPLETWVFVSTLMLTGLLIIVCGINQASFSAMFIFAGIATASTSYLILVKKIKKRIESF